MLNLYLVQTSDKYGPNSFLPLAICYQWMYAQADEQVKQNYHVEDVLIEKISPKEYPNCDIIVGGPNVDKRNPNFFDDFPMFDIAVLGEGEPAFRQILKQRLKNKNYKGIPSVFPKGGDIPDLPERFRDLEAIPSPILNGFYDWISRSQTW